MALANSALEYALAMTTSGENERKPHARAHHFMRKGREEENTRSQHRGKGQDDQGLQADGAGEFNCFFQHPFKFPEFRQRVALCSPLL